MVLMMMIGWTPYLPELKDHKAKYGIDGSAFPEQKHRVVRV